MTIWFKNLKNDDSKKEPFKIRDRDLIPLIKNAKIFHGRQLQGEANEELVNVQPRMQAFRGLTANTNTSMPRQFGTYLTQ